MVLDIEHLKVQYKESNGLPVKNRTFSYLFPALYIKNPNVFAVLKSLGSTLVGVFLKDSNFCRPDLIKGKSVVFVALRNIGNNIVVDSAVNTFQKTDTLVTSYDYSLGGRVNYIKILVFEVDETAYNYFLAGKYSQMYEKYDLTQLPFPFNKNSVVSIMGKGPHSRSVFCDLLKLTFGTELTPDELEPGVECELPWDYGEGSIFLETIEVE